MDANDLEIGTIYRAPQSFYFDGQLVTSEPGGHDIPWPSFEPGETFLFLADEKPYAIFLWIRYNIKIGALIGASNFFDRIEPLPEK